MSESLLSLLYEEEQSDTSLSVFYRRETLTSPTSPVFVKLFFLCLSLEFSHGQPLKHLEADKLGKGRHKQILQTKVGDGKQKSCCIRDSRDSLM